MSNHPSQSQSKHLIQNLSIPTHQFTLQPLLLTLCKPSTIPLQIDFLTLPQTLQQINSFHQRTCQQIVQFVDAHCQQYLIINQKFQLLQTSVNNVQKIVKQVGVRLNDYAKVYYNNQGTIQQLITNYQLSILEHVLLTYCQHCTELLTKFVTIFQSITTKPITLLSFNQKHLLIRFCHQFSTLRLIMSHHIVQQSVPQTGRVLEMVENLVDEVEFYLSEQLQRVVVVGRSNQKILKRDGNNNNNNNKQTLHNNKQTTTPNILHDIKLCYKYLNKQQQYYRLIQQHIISIQITSAQKQLISQKINLISGRNIQVVQEYFRAVFNIFSHVPMGYPVQRILEVIFVLLKKQQIRFIYTYTLPIFPISYNCYIRSIDQIKCIIGNKQDLDNNDKQNNDNIKQFDRVRQILRRNHNWDLRRWVDVREKNVIDRCGKDWDKVIEVAKESSNKSGGRIVSNNSTITNEISPSSNILAPDLIKWLQIIFKQNCKIDGVKNYIVSLALKVVNKYAMVIQKSLNQQSLLQQQSEFINVYVKTYHKIYDVVKGKLEVFYDCDNQGEEINNNQDKEDKNNNKHNDNKKQLEQIINKIAESCRQSLHKSIQKVILSNTRLLSKSCCGCLQPYKQFIMKIIKQSSSINISKQQQYKCVNSTPILFKPLSAYLQNALKLSQQAKQWIGKIVTKQVMRYYDQSYVSEIYQYGRVNLSVQQLAQVMGVIGYQRGVLFVNNGDKEGQIKE